MRVEKESASREGEYRRSASRERQSGEIGQIEKGCE